MIRRAPAIYVDQAETLGAIAIIRSLGAAGYEVHAASELKSALGAQSRYAACSPVHPPVGTGRFVAWFREYLVKNQIVAVIPSERLILALGEALHEFKSLIPFGDSTESLLKGFGKFDLFQSAIDAGLTKNITPFMIVDFDQNRRSSSGEIHFPAFIKTDGLYSREPGTKGEVTRVEGEEELDKALASLSLRYQRAVVQSFAPGMGIGACFVVWAGEVKGEFLHNRLHEVPYTGGISSWREEFLHDGIKQDAISRIRALGWSGPAMVEYRWDPLSGDYCLMEMNSRFWGSLHLPYYCGVDFPKILLESFLADRGVETPEPLMPSPSRRHDLSCRHLPAELQHYWSRIKAREISFRSKISAVFEFIGLFFDAKVRSDLGSFSGDRVLLVRAMAQFGWNAWDALIARFKARNSDKFVKRKEAV